MKSNIFTFLLGLLVYIVHALPSSHVEHESSDDFPAHAWVKRSRLEPHISLPVRIGLSQQNIDNSHGHNLLMDISDPYSANYGRHYSAEEVIDLFAPSNDSIDAVRSWLESSGIHAHRISLSNNKQWLQFDAKASELESLLYTTYHEYINKEDGGLSIACDRYHLPKELQPHVDFVKPGVAIYAYAPRPSKIVKRATPSPVITFEDPRFTPKTQPFPIAPEKLKALPKSKACYKAVTPDCIRALYNITDTITRVEGNSIGIYETEGELYDAKSLDKFFELFAGDVPQGTRPIFDAIDGAPPPKTPTEDRSEADLDFQAVYPLVYPDEVVNFQVDDYWFEEKRFVKGIFNTFLDAIDGSYCNYSAYGVTGNTPGFDAVYPNAHKKGYKGQLQCGVYKPTNVISLSYGLGERVLPMNYQRRQCNEYMKLGLQGISIIFSSGDRGVESGHCIGKEYNVFAPGTPVDCPYVTGVGSTAIPKGQAPVGGVEVATNAFGSGGGFSNIFPRPDYQSASVESYFDNHDPGYKYYKTQYDKSPNANVTKGGIYNRIGRGYPDIAAIGQNFAGVQDSHTTLFFGTSVSAPLIAGIIARINNRRMAVGKGPVGFLNPTLYSHPHMFHDVVHGINGGCGTRGFHCTPGWDPVTGLGTPNYGKMLDVFMSLA